MAVPSRFEVAQNILGDCYVAKKTTKVNFPVSQSSPFPDHYDIEGERIALRDLVESDQDVDEMDPRWQRFMTLLEREEELKQMKSLHQQRQYADAIVPDHEARALKGIGVLVDEESDVMSIHTKEAYRLFIGRTRAESTSGYGVTSGKKVAAILRSIWNLSANDNPYADWVLLQVTERVSQLRQQLSDEAEVYEKALTKLAERGLRVSVLKSRAPVNVELGFRSPYGYMLVDLIMGFDWYTRVIKTMMSKDRIDGQQGKTELRIATKNIRALFESVLPYQRYMMHENLKQLSRSDYLPGADEEAKKRVLAAEEIFGRVPKDVFTGEVRPRHSRRRADVSEQEMRLLAEVIQQEAVGDERAAHNGESLL
jgi:integrating conjugative element protein (TIGR03761 family)